MSENPFEKYDIDPLEGPRAITERFRELVEEAAESEREALRVQWEALITHPRERLRIALHSFPVAQPVPAPAPSAPNGAHPPLGEPDGLEPLELKDLALAPSVAAALGESAGAAQTPHLLPTLAEDACLRENP